MLNSIEIMIKNIKEGEPYDEAKLNEICQKARTEGYVFNLENSQKIQAPSTIGTMGMEARFTIPLALGPRMIFGIGTFKPGCSMTEHWHQCHEEVLFLLQGEGKMRLSSVDKKIDNWFDLKPGSAVYMPARIVHSYENTGKEEWLFIWVMSPPDSELYRFLGLCESQVDSGPYPWKEVKVIRK